MQDLQKVLHINITSPSSNDFVDITSDLESISFYFSANIIVVKDKSTLRLGDIIEQEGELNF